MSERRMWVNADEDGNLIIHCNGSTFVHHCNDEAIEEPEPGETPPPKAEKVPPPELVDVINYLIVDKHPPESDELHHALREIKAGGELVIFVQHGEIHGDLLQKARDEAAQYGVRLRVQQLKKRHGE
ncbi:hypothetical protein [Streptomyces sp. NPDC002082]|uniref:hypothetical protein n=1 Tax=Streptomyces sp. NPDC002082 TaxID=3154772 RepID=UPI003325D03B